MPAPQGNRNAAKGAKWAEALRQALAKFEDKDRGIERGEALESASPRLWSRRPLPATRTPRKRSAIA
jgi:hypothetical protein